MKSVPLADAKAPAPYTSLVLALEFVHSNETAFNTLTPLTDTEIRSLDRVNYYDFLFMAVYGAFLGLLTYKTGLATEHGPLKKLAWAALVITISDLLENIMMLNITSLYVNGQNDFTPYVNFLPAFTWAKWGLIAATFAGLATVLIQRGMFSKVVSVLLLLPAILLVFTIVDYHAWINRFTTSIFLGFIILLIFAVCFKKSGITSSLADN